MPVEKRSNTSIIRQARRVIILLGVGVGAIELLTHYLQYGIHVDWYLFMEVGLYAVFIPLLGSILLNSFHKVERGQMQAFEILNHQLAVARRFSSLSEWNDLIWWIAEYPTTILPMRQVAIYIQKDQKSSLELAAVWSEGNSSSEILKRAAQPHPCSVCQAGTTSFHRLEWDQTEADEQESLYCLPLFLGGELLGLLQMTGTKDLPEGGVQILKNIAPDITAAMERARMQRASSSQAQNHEEDRQRIARDLHDTLGQSVAFLRLRLDHLARSSNPESQIGEIRDEIEVMRDAADTAYQQVRETLADLKANTPRNLLHALQEMAQLISNRSGIPIKLHQAGQPGLLRPHTRRQILYICREALYNIEKHANAQHVQVDIAWQADALVILIQDDGSGFNAGEVDTSQHYGLSIMRDRAGDIHAELQVESVHGEGTRVSLRLPLAAQAEERDAVGESGAIPLIFMGSERNNDETAGS